MYINNRLSIRIMYLHHAGIEPCMDNGVYTKMHGSIHDVNRNLFSPVIFICAYKYPTQIHNTVVVVVTDLYTRPIFAHANISTPFG